MSVSTRKPPIFRHSVNADWGHGIVVEEHPDKVYLYFEHAGRRAIVNDPKYRQLLVAVELPPAEVQALVATVEKRSGPLRKPPVRKKKAAAAG